jgi:hypothetical protein
MELADLGVLDPCLQGPSPRRASLHLKRAYSCSSAAQCYISTYRVALRPLCLVALARCLRGWALEPRSSIPTVRGSRVAIASLLRYMMHI